MPLFIGSRPPSALSSHSAALAAYEPGPLDVDPEPSRPDELRTYQIWRDYMIHEDDLLASRLGSFLTMNGFLIGASVLTIGGTAQTFARADLLPGYGTTILILGAVVHGLVAVIGFLSARLTASSIQAATDSLRFLRDRGNYRLRHAIERGDVPYLTNGRGLSDDERRDLDRGSGIMRGIPAMMQYMWLLLLVLPIAVYLLTT